MRTKEEMMDLFIDFANKEERVRAVLLEGSRADPSAPNDPYQDYDINLFVKETNSFINDQSWLTTFGTPLIIQEPEWVDTVTGFFDDRPHDFDLFYSFMVIFDDGIRIDFCLIPTHNRSLMKKNDEPVIVLLDKDKVLPPYPEPSNRVYWVQKPSEGQFHGCCNNFWWCLNNAAKGIARDELPYAMEMLNHYVRDMLHKMAEWYLGVQTDFLVSAGKMGKYFKRYLPPEIYAQYAATYSGSDYQDVWKAVDAMCDLFHTLALTVAAHFGFTYRQQEEDGMRRYLKIVKGMVLNQ